MRTCFQSGQIGPQEIRYPEAAWEYDYGALHPRVACSNLKCTLCGEAVEAVHLHESHGFAGTPEGLWTQVMAGDLSSLTPSMAARVYLCRCFFKTAHYTEGMTPSDVDPERYEPIPWRCQGHPVLSLPMTLDGV